MQVQRLKSVSLSIIAAKLTRSKIKSRELSKYLAFKNLPKACLPHLQTKANLKVKKNPPFSLN